VNGLLALSGYYTPIFTHLFTASPAAITFLLKQLYIWRFQSRFH